MEAAKTAGRVAADAATNPRHNLELVGALLVGTNIGSDDQVHSLLNALSSAGVSPDIQIIAGLAIVAGARVLSWWRRSHAH